MKNLQYHFRKTGLILAFLLLLVGSSFGQIINVGSGSYTTVFPGTDEAGRNTYPSGTPFVTDLASNKPVPTNDWWSAKIKNSHSDNLFNYPYTLKTVNSGLVVTYIPWGVIDDILPVTVGVVGLNAAAANVSDFSDWTVTMDWSNSDHHFKATSGIGMPFLYFTKATTDVAQIKVNEGSVVIDGEMLIITDARNDADFAIYAPEGSVWTQEDNIYTSDLNGQNYWSMTFIPLDASSITAVANEYKKYAYVFPTNTITTWSYDASTSIVRTEFTVETEMKEGSDTTMLLGLLPHQWANLSADSPEPDQYAYSSVRGEVKTVASNGFSVENTFYGILPTLPYLDNYSDGFDLQKINDKVQLLENDGLSTWTDSYNEGQMMNRLIQTARIADLIGNNTAKDKILNTIKSRLEDWLSANSDEVAFLFYYNQTWSAMIGYPAGHGQDGNLNDHHFHWGYFIHAAAFVEQFDPGWASQWGEMVNFLVRDAACDTRDDELFPFLRNFSPYAGHCWANGFATFPQGNDQESTSESMQFNSSLIHWGAITGNDDIRDLGIYLYTTEQSAIEEYWFDMYDRNFSESQQYSLVSRVWGNSYDNGTFWTSDIAASYGIEMYPIHGGSMYLGHNLSYVEQLWNEIEQNTGILSNEVNDNLWHDVMWKYLSFLDPAMAIEMYDSYPDRSLKFGISDAHTYHWLHAMNVLGNVDTSITSDSPLGVAFNNDGEVIYTAHNYSDQPVNVTFSDGYVLEVPAESMATSLDISLSGILSSNSQQAYPGGSVELNVLVNGGIPDSIEFFDAGMLIGQVAEAPFTFEADNLFAGQHSFYAKIYDGSNFNISNLVSVIVGGQLPFSGDPIPIPGSFQAASFDVFEGGIGQDISYSDTSPGNNGDYRLDEYVDAFLDASEGGAVGWIAAGEWLEYTIDVQEAGYYTLDFRYACGNQNGGGPFQLLTDGEVIGPEISVNYTGDWHQWDTKTVDNIPLNVGVQVLRVFFEEGELNLGEFTFSYESPLLYDLPVSDAGENILVVLPEATTILDGTNSSDPGGADLAYSWSQVYGPSNLVFSDSQIAQPTVFALEEGVYLVKLTVNNGSYSDDDEMYIISSYETNIAPVVSISSPLDNAEYIEEDLVIITASASDLIGYVEQVEFYVNGELIGTVLEAPYSINWTPLPGDYTLTAIATDNDGSSTTSEAVQITIKPAPSCYGTSYNGDFDYEFSPDDNNPTLTFIPSAAGVGTPTCILYYGTNANLLPGYNVTPNVPYTLSASEGTKIYFYYTYSYPGEIERNNSEHKDTYEIGSCKVTSLENTNEEASVRYYPNPVNQILNLELPEGENMIYVYNLMGQLITRFKTSNSFVRYDMSDYKNGVYLFNVFNENKLKAFKVIRN